MIEAVIVLPATAHVSNWSSGNLGVFGHFTAILGAVKVVWYGPLQGRLICSVHYDDK